MSGADLESIVNKAAVRALKRHISLTDKKSKLGVITQEDLVLAAKDVLGRPVNVEKHSTGVITAAFLTCNLKLLISV